MSGLGVTTQVILAKEATPTSQYWAFDFPSPPLPCHTGEVIRRSDERIQQSLLFNRCVLSFPILLHGFDGMGSTMTHQQMLVAKRPITSLTLVRLSSLMHSGNMYLDGMTGGKGAAFTSLPSTFMHRSRNPVMHVPHVILQIPSTSKRLATLGTRFNGRRWMGQATMCHDQSPLGKILATALHPTYIRLFHPCRRYGSFVFVRVLMTAELFSSRKTGLTCVTFVRLWLHMASFMASKMVPQGKRLVAVWDAACKASGTVGMAS